MKRKSLPTGRDFLFVEGYGNENPGAFQSHAPLAGRDRVAGYSCPFTLIFQPTRPLRGATKCNRASLGMAKFQPTRPLRGATLLFRSELTPSLYFNPRAPCGARLTGSVIPLVIADFNPRAPCGARQQKCTNHYAHFCDNRQISDAFAQNAACQGILLLFDAGKPCGFWVRTAQVISARLCFAL